MSTFETEYHPSEDRQALLASLEVDYQTPQMWANGPVHNKYRKVTDKFCLVIFLSFLLFLIWTTFYASINTDPKGIKKVYDSSGNVCGEGEATDYPLLYLVTFTAPYKSVCVKQCPSFDYNEIKGKLPGEGKLSAFEFNNLYAGTSHTGLPDMTESEAFAFNPEWANGYFTKQQWDNYLEKIKIDCLTNNEILYCTPEAGLAIYDSYPVLDTFCEPLTPKAGLMFNRVESKFNNGLIGDLLFAKSIFIKTALMTLAFSIVFIIFTATCTKVTTWLIFLGTIIMLITSGVVLLGSFIYTGPLNDALNPLRVKYIHFFASNQITIIIVGSILILSGLFVLLLMCKHRKSIKLSIPLISIASKTTLKNPLLNLVSFFTLIL